METAARRCDIIAVKRGGGILVYTQMIEAPEDKGKFQQVYDRYLGLMLHTARRVLGDGRDAEDAVQEAFISIAKNISKISDPVCNKTRSYVVTIVENKAIDIYRARRRKPAEPLNEETEGIPFRVEENILADAIARLPARYRELILLKYADGYTDRELMHMLGLSYGGVRSLDARAKKQLKKLLEEEGIDV